jgi:hypothetical protein
MRVKITGYRLGNRANSILGAALTTARRILRRKLDKSWSRKASASSSVVILGTMRFIAFDLLGVHITGAYRADRTSHGNVHKQRAVLHDSAGNQLIPGRGCFRSGTIRGWPRSGASISCRAFEAKGGCCLLRRVSRRARRRLPRRFGRLPAGRPSRYLRARRARPPKPSAYRGRSGTGSRIAPGRGQAVAAMQRVADFVVEQRRGWPGHARPRGISRPRCPHG